MRCFGVTFTIYLIRILDDARLYKRRTGASSPEKLPVTMSQLTFTLNDGNKIPFLAFGTGTSLRWRDVTEPVSLAIEKGFTHLDGAQVRARNRRSFSPSINGWNLVLSERRHPRRRDQGVRKAQGILFCHNQAQLVLGAWRNCFGRLAQVLS